MLFLVVLEKFFKGLVLMDLQGSFPFSYFISLCLFCISLCLSYLILVFPHLLLIKEQVAAICIEYGNFTLTPFERSSQA